MTKTDPRVSILMLTFNAPGFVKLSVESLRNRTMGIDYKLVVVDNASDPPTRALVSDLRDRRLIDTLVLSDENTVFAGGTRILTLATTCFSIAISKCGGQLGWCICWQSTTARD